MAVRVKGVTLPEKKRVEIALTYLFGIGVPSAKKILKEIGVEPQTRTKDLTSTEIRKMTDAIDAHYVVEGDLRRDVMLNVKRLKDIGTYRGIRHAKGLPVRGQRTKTNTRTVRGNVRKTAGSGKRKAAAKT